MLKSVKFFNISFCCKVDKYIVPLDMEWCISHFVKWQIHPLFSNETLYWVDYLWIHFISPPLTERCEIQSSCGCGELVITSMWSHHQGHRVIQGHMIYSTAASIGITVVPIIFGPKQTSRRWKFMVYSTSSRHKCYTFFGVDHQAFSVVPENTIY